MEFTYSYPASLFGVRSSGRYRVALGSWKYSEEEGYGCPEDSREEF